MQFNFYPIKAEMAEDFHKVLTNRMKKLKKQIKFALGCRGERINQDIWDAIFSEMEEVQSHDLEVLKAQYAHMFSKIDSILGEHIA